MTLKTLYVARHGFRSTWTVDSTTGVYSSAVPSPTGIPSDPALTSHGVTQSHELARHLAKISPPVEAVFSSPWYRCLQTMTPFVEGKGHESPTAERPDGQKKILGEYGICEWYGSAPFKQPQPASPERMKGFFPTLDVPSLVASADRHPKDNGETPVELYERVRRGLDAIVRYCDANNIETAVLCSHAASVIAIGRVLTNDIPQQLDREDFHAFTCGLSTFKRVESTETPDSTNLVGDSLWKCEVDMDTSYLANGAERGWLFTTDEGFSGDQGTDTRAKKPRL